MAKTFRREEAVEPEGDTIVLKPGEFVTRRVTSPAAERWLGVEHVVVSGSSRVEVIDYMGDDSRVAQAARVSTAKDRMAKPFERLIGFLLGHRHMSPFEQCQVTFRIVCPLFVAQQLLRHRAMHFNQLSFRYVEATHSVYLWPESAIGLQPLEGNVQGRDDSGTVAWRQAMLRSIQAAARRAFASYRLLLSNGVAREIARSVLPQSTMTVLYVTGDLRNVLHFLDLRLAPDAQAEIRDIARVVERFVAEWVPVTYAAWLEHVHMATTLPWSSVRALEKVLASLSPEALEVARAAVENATPAEDDQIVLRGLIEKLRKAGAGR